LSKSATADFDAAAEWISKEIHSPGRVIARSDSDEAIQIFSQHGLLRFARNDEAEKPKAREQSRAFL
jgi:hypothetical protein